jgi:hypothetical protein
MRKGLWIVSLGMLAIAVAVPRPGLGAEKTADEKLRKQISIMEKILDEALVDSENALVKSTHPTRGVYLDGYGFVFTMELGIVDDQFRWEALSKLLDVGEGYTVEREEKSGEGETVITIKKNKEKAEAKAKAEAEKGEKEAVDIDARWGLVKKELIGVIRDYGDTIARAKPDEWFTIFATPLIGAWGSGESERLVIRVQMKDIEQFSTGTLTEKEFESKVQVLES